MRFCKLIILLCVVLLIGLSCTDEDKGTGTQDSIPPARIIDLAEIDPTDTSLTLTWTAPGDDDTVGTADAYDIRYCLGVLNDSTWDSSFQVPSVPAPQEAGSAETLLVVGLSADTSYHFAVRAADEVGNWSAMSNDCLARTLPEVDTIAPTTITNLRIIGSSYTYVILGWTAPGDDGDSGQAVAYDLRFSETEITGENFDNASQVPTPPQPLKSGVEQIFELGGLIPNTSYYFALKTVDEAENYSEISNVVFGATRYLHDLTAPETIDDLRVGSVLGNTVTLHWTAPGDDADSGTAAQYDVRYSRWGMTSGSFVNADTAVGEPLPSPAGSSESFTVHGLEENAKYYFAVKTADEIPNWSAISKVTWATTSTIPDTIAPSPITDLEITDEQKSLIALCWTIPGDDGDSGKVAGYDLRYAGTAITEENFANAERYKYLSSPDLWDTRQCVSVSNLDSNTFYFFAIKGVDDAGNWSGISNVVHGYTADTIPPAAITDLAIYCTGPTWVELQWTVPGDDSTAGHLAQYDIRYSTSLITDDSFAEAVVVENPPDPRRATTRQRYTVTELDPLTTYYIAIKAADEQPNWTGLSNVVSITTYEGEAPAAITDLHISSATSNSLTLVWTAPGDDGMSGTAAEYDLRYSTDLITEEQFFQALSVPDVPLPSVAGTAESFTIGGLESATGYYVTLRAADEVPNWSPISNVVAGITQTGADSIPPAPISDLCPRTMRLSSISLAWHAPGDNAQIGQAAAYDIRYALAPITEETWESAFQMEDEPPPGPAQFEELIPIGGLNMLTTYYFAVKTVDTAGNWSPISNTVVGTTTGQPDSWHIVVGDEDNGASSIDLSPDGGYVLCGKENSSGLGAKLNAAGQLIWEKNFAAVSNYDLVSVAGAEDGGCVILGWGIVHWPGQLFPHGILDMWKISPSGEVKSGDAYDEYPDYYYGESINRDVDGGFLVSQHNSRNTAFFLKLDNSGYRQWECHLEGGSVQSVIRFINGDFGVLGTTTNIFDRVVSGDTYIARINDVCKYVWRTTIGGEGNDIGESIIQTADGGVLIAGRTLIEDAPGEVMFLVKLDDSGEVVWEKQLTAAFVGRDRSIAPTVDGNYIVVGSTALPGQSNSDIYLLKINDSGDILWEKTIGGPYGEGGQSIVPAWDGGFVIAGWTDAFGTEGPVVYVIKVNEDGEL